MNGVALGLALIILGAAALAFRADDRRWHEPWSIQDRHTFRRVIPIGILSAFVVMGAIGAAIAALAAPR